MCVILYSLYGCWWGDILFLSEIYKKYYYMLFDMFYVCTLFCFYTYYAPHWYVYVCAFGLVECHLLLWPFCGFVSAFVSLWRVCVCMYAAICFKVKEHVS
jgi:hypothetical protein